MKINSDVKDYIDKSPNDQIEILTCLREINSRKSASRH